MLATAVYTGYGTLYSVYMQGIAVFKVYILGTVLCIVYIFAGHNIVYRIHAGQWAACILYTTMCPVGSAQLAVPM